MKHKVQQLKQRGFYYQFFRRQFPSWLYTIAMVIFAAVVYVWIKFFLVVQ